MGLSKCVLRGAILLMLSTIFHSVLRLCFQPAVHLQRLLNYSTDTVDRNAACGPPQVHFGTNELKLQRAERSDVILNRRTAGLSQEIGATTTFPPRKDFDVFRPRSLGHPLNRSQPSADNSLTASAVPQMFYQGKLRGHGAGTTAQQHCHSNAKAIAQTAAKR